VLGAIAFRNLARNRRRTALALLIVASGAAALLLTTGFMRYSFNGLREALIHGGLGHLEVAPIPDMGGSDAGPDRAAPPSFRGWREVRDAIESMPHVVGATGAIVMHGLVSRDERTLPFVGAGLETDREQRMQFHVRPKEGRPLQVTPPVQGEDEALLGLGLARQLGASVGDVVTLTVFTSDGMLNALDVRVCGLVTTGIQDLDERFLRTHLVTAQRVLNTDAVSSVIVMLDDTRETERARERIAHTVGPRLRVTDWQTRAPFYGQVRALYGGIFAFLGSVVLVLVCLSSSNTLLMTVMERTREIGSLLAIGTSTGQVVRMIVLEAAWLGLIGGALGSLLGLVLTAAIHALRIEMPPPPGAVESMPLRLEIVAWDPLWITVLTVAMLVVSAAVPAWRVARLRIAEALVHV
jgi:putative ABC transport system permease protein